jgi:hypothetical protein
MLGLIPQDDDACLQVVKPAEHGIEEIKIHAKARYFGEVKYQKRTTIQEKEKVINRNKDNRKE